MDDSPPPRCFALVPCAGVGTRAGAPCPKQYLALAGRPLVAHTLAALARVPRLHGTLVVLASDDALFEAQVPQFSGPGCWRARCGGASRAATVAAGLQALRGHGVRDADWVLVHDAARCLLQPAWVERLIDACFDDPVGGLLALPVADTLKRAADGRAQETLDRSALWAAQTPQMFRLGALAAALHAAGDAVTDEASAMELAGHAPRLVAGDARNLKITWPGDVAVAEALLGAMA